MNRRRSLLCLLFLCATAATIVAQPNEANKAAPAKELAGKGKAAVDPEAERILRERRAQAGGFTPFAKKGDIIVLRSTNGKQQRMRFKYKEVISGKKTDQNISLRPGDTVVVP